MIKYGTSAISILKRTTRRVTKIRHKNSRQRSAEILLNTTFRKLITATKRIFGNNAVIGKWVCIFYAAMNLISSCNSIKLRNMSGRTIIDVGKCMLYRNIMMLSSNVFQEKLSQIRLQVRVFFDIINAYIVSYSEQNRKINHESFPAMLASTIGKKNYRRSIEKLLAGYPLTTRQLLAMRNIRHKFGFQSVYLGFR